MDRTGPHRPHRERNPCLRGQKDHRRHGPLGGQTFLNLQPVDTRYSHLQHDAAGPRRGIGVEELPARPISLAPEVHYLRQIADGFARAPVRIHHKHRRLVVYDHGRLPASWPPEKKAAPRPLVPSLAWSTAPRRVDRVGPPGHCHLMQPPGETDQPATTIALRSHPLKRREMADWPAQTPSSWVFNP